MQQAREQCHAEVAGQEAGDGKRPNGSHGLCHLLVAMLHGRGHDAKGIGVIVGRHRTNVLIVMRKLGLGTACTVHNGRRCCYLLVAMLHGRGQTLVEMSAATGRTPWCVRNILATLGLKPRRKPRKDDRGQGVLRPHGVRRSRDLKYGPFATADGRPNAEGHRILTDWYRRNKWPPAYYCYRFPRQRRMARELGLDDDELVSLCLLAVVRAVLRYKPTNEGGRLLPTFDSYAARAVAGAVGHYITGWKTAKRSAAYVFSGNAPMAGSEREIFTQIADTSSGNDPPEECERRRVLQVEVRKAIRTAIPLPRDRELLMAAWGIGAGEGTPMLIDATRNAGISVGAARARVQRAEAALKPHLEHLIAGAA